jgi:universal stress protein E
MMSVGRILLAVDFTDAGSSAQNEAALLARTFGVELELAHAAPDTPPDDPDALAVSRHVERLLDRIAKDLEADGVRVARPFRVVLGQPPAAALLAWLGERPYDLVVLGAGAKTAADRVLLGSTAERVVREAPCPVWLTRPCRDHAEVRRILVAVDGAAPSPEVLLTAAALARSFVAELCLLNVVPAGEGFGSRRTQEVAAKSVAGFEAALRRVDMHGVAHAVVERRGKPAVEIVGAAEELDADLLILGSAGRTGLSRIVHGNTAEKILRQVPCSMLTVPCSVPAT